MSTQYVAHFIGEQFDHHQIIVTARSGGRARSKAKKKFFKTHHDYDAMMVCSKEEFDDMYEAYCYRGVSSLKDRYPDADKIKHRINGLLPLIHILDNLKEVA